MFSLPPSAHDGFLRTPIPVLDGLPADDPVWRFEAGRAEQDLLARSNPDSAPWLLEMAELLRDRGRFQQALSFIDQAIEIAIRTDADRIVPVALRTSIQIWQGNYHSARTALNEIAGLLLVDPRPDAAAIYEETSGKLLLRNFGGGTFEFESAGQKFAKALDLYTDLGDAGGQIRSICGIGSSLAGRGLYFNALEEFEKGFVLSAESGHWKELGLLLGCAAFAFRDQGYRHNVHELFQLSVDWATFLGKIPQRIRNIGGHGGLCRMEFSQPGSDLYQKALALMYQAIWEAKEIGAGPLMLETQIDLASTYKKAGDRESHEKSLMLIEEVVKTEAFEGAHRIIDWSDFILGRISAARDERIATLLEEAIEGSADPFFVFDLRSGSEASHFDLLNEFRNSAADRLLDMGKTDVTLLADLADRPEFVGLASVLMRAATERTSYEDEVPVLMPGGETVWFARRVTPAGSGAVLTLRDVTSGHKIEEALRMAADRAREADRAKSEFLANMSHEVRTPINGVLGLAELLRGQDLGPTAKKYVEGIISSGNILLKVIGDVLDLSKIEARKMEINTGPVKLRSLIAEVVALFGGQVASSGVDLRPDVDADLPVAVVLDGTSLRQVLANLVGNAIKFTEVGHVDVTVAKDGNRLRFEVCDTGRGVPEDQLKTIFEPFQQVGGESDFGGTGLGLTISRRLVELMGGQMGVISQFGKGSKFYFSLPLVEAPAETFTEPISDVQDTVRFEGKRVLLVEDNPVNVLVSEGMLSMLGCEVTTAENGLEALNLLEEHEYDLVLMDIRMPVMDGLTATRTIRSGGSHIPIVALTAGALTQERDACMEAGMDDYLVKPFSLKALRETMFRLWN